MNTAANPPPLLLRTLRGEPVERPPVWLYRQAGRYLPEYREVRAGSDFETLCRTPELAAEVTLQPIRRYPLDASIVFSDLLVPLEGLGFDVQHSDRGPVVVNPPRSGADIRGIGALEVHPAVDAPRRTLEILARELPPHVARIGFSGSPWTLALYLLQGSSSKDFVVARAFLHQEPASFRLLLDRLADGVADYLALQVEGGAQVIQIFDSWAGIASRAQFETLARPATERLIARFAERTGGTVPLLWFVRGPAELASLAATSDATGVAVDYSVDLPRFAAQMPAGKALQGNLDPAWLIADADAAARATSRLLDAVGDRPRFVFNLGHGITPQARPESVQAVIETVTKRRRAGERVA